MKWKIPEHPHVGDIRFVTRFALLPTEVVSKLDGKSYIIWLQLYVAEQVYTFDRGLFGDLDFRWVTTNKTIHV